MGVGEAIEALGAGERPASFEQFSAAIDPQWIADALAATGTASVRRRKLPAEHVVWLVIGMGLFRDRSIAQVVHHLDLVLPARDGGRGRTSPTRRSSRRAISSAPRPLAALFTQTATAWAHRRGRRRPLARAGRLRPRRHHAARRRHAGERRALRAPAESARRGRGLPATAPRHAPRPARPPARRRGLRPVPHQ